MTPGRLLPTLPPAAPHGAGHGGVDEDAPTAASGNPCSISVQNTAATSRARGSIFCALLLRSSRTSSKAKLGADREHERGLNRPSVRLRGQALRGATRASAVVGPNVIRRQACKDETDRESRSHSWEEAWVREDANGGDRKRGGCAGSQNLSGGHRIAEGRRKIAARRTSETCNARHRHSFKGSNGSELKEHEARPRTRLKGSAVRTCCPEKDKKRKTDRELYRRYADWSKEQSETRAPHCCEFILGPSTEGRWASGGRVVQPSIAQARQSKPYQRQTVPSSTTMLTLRRMPFRSQVLPFRRSLATGSQVSTSAQPEGKVSFKQESIILLDLIFLQEDASVKGSVSLSFIIPNSTSTPFRATGTNGKIHSFWTVRRRWHDLSMMEFFVRRVAKVTGTIRPARVPALHRSLVRVRGCRQVLLSQHRIPATWSGSEGVLIRMMLSSQPSLGTLLSRAPIHEFPDDTEEVYAAVWKEQIRRAAKAAKASSSST
ncbi:hypothetical protein B0H12DRAFT_1224085 [Mycena haematopus]|nr:hypothetical protein B0H12DRAFT_1224085 [Mycena haematopus]